MKNSPHQPDARKKLDALTGLRFAAAAMIVIHHSRGMLGVPKDFLGGVSLQFGVSFFFVLSGFILTHVYPSLSEPGAVRRFLIARFARIWPAHFLTFLLVIALQSSHGLAPEAGSQPLGIIAVANAAMLHAWVPATGWFFSFNAVSWSISTELFFYLVFPMLIAGFSRTWWWKGLAAVLLAITLVTFCELTKVPAFAAAGPFEVNRAGLLYVSPLIRLAEFILGMLAAMLWKRHGALFRMKTGLATVVECLCVVFCAWSMVMFSEKTALQQNLGESWAAYLRHSGAAPAFALLIVMFASQAGWISRVFGSRVLVLLGEISFSIYLLHQIFLRWLTAHHSALAGAGLGDQAIYLGFCILLLAVSWLVWRCVERPARRFLLRLVPSRSLPALC